MNDSTRYWIASTIESRTIVKYSRIHPLAQRLEALDGIKWLGNYGVPHGEGHRLLTGGRSDSESVHEAHWRAAPLLAVGGDRRCASVWSRPATHQSARSFARASTTATILSERGRLMR